MFSITLIIIVTTAIVSIIGFGNQQVIDNLIFYPPAVTEKKQYYRFITCGFIHADTAHLAFNMISFYFFSQPLVEPKFIEFFGDYGRAMLLIMYVMALVVCLLPTYFKNKNNQTYRSLGASGAVSAVVFAGLMISPLSLIGFFIIPPVIPGFIFGPLYLICSAYMEKRGGGNINHSAHIWGAIFGVVFIIIATKLYSNYDIWSHFIDDVKFYLKTKFNLG
ncbi:MAG: rhomboid family intramembrane serine protease [Chitinophagaceae bacterium]|nr:rhomboid family intramembrane serine protease [Chitinophagaceae bacterium]HEV8084787.1 rhomboid family intramembrane serine protease [Chitinophagaceae bacterium]